MSRIQRSVLKEISREIAAGNICYVHRASTEITIIDSSLEDTEMITAQDQKQSEIEEKIEKYIKVEKPSNKEQLVIMKDFLPEVSDKSIRKQLSNALNRKNPIRNFIQSIEGDIGLNQYWRSFNLEETNERVSNFISDAYNV